MTSLPIIPHHNHLTVMSYSAAVIRSNSKGYTEDIPNIQKYIVSLFDLLECDHLHAWHDSKLMSAVSEFLIESSGTRSKATKRKITGICLNNGTLLKYGLSQSQLEAINITAVFNHCHDYRHPNISFLVSGISTKPVISALLAALNR